MAISDVELHFVSKFRCERPADASPGRKGEHRIARLYDVKTSHCLVEMVVGTRGTRVSRIDGNNYSGHVPDAPVLVEPGRIAQYREGRQACEDGWLRFKAVACGVAVGACVGFTGGTVLAAGLALLHLSLPSLVGATGYGLWMYLALTHAAIGGLVMGAHDRWQWKQAAKVFAGLEQMAIAGEAFSKDNELREQVRDLAARHMCGSDWALQQAAYELDALVRKPTMTVVYAEPA